VTVNKIIPFCRNSKSIPLSILYYRLKVQAIQARNSRKKSYVGIQNNSCRNSSGGAITMMKSLKSWISGSQSKTCLCDRTDHNIFNTLRRNWNMSWRNATRSTISCVASYQRQCDGFRKIHRFFPRRDLVEHASLVDIQSYCTNKSSARFVSSTSGDSVSPALSQLVEYKEANGNCNVPKRYKDNPA